MDLCGNILQFPFHQIGLGNTSISMRLRPMVLINENWTRRSIVMRSRARDFAMPPPPPSGALDSPPGQHLPANGVAMYASVDGTSGQSFVSKRMAGEGGMEIPSNSVGKLLIKVNGEDRLPGVSALHQNYLNPFTPSTTILYDLSVAGLVTLKVHRAGSCYSGQRAAGSRYRSVLMTNTYALFNARLAVKGHMWPLVS